MDENPIETYEKAVSAASRGSSAKQTDASQTRPGCSSSSITESAAASTWVSSGGGPTGTATRTARKPKSLFDMMCDSDLDSDGGSVPMLAGSRAAASKSSPQQSTTGALAVSTTIAGGVNPRQTKYLPRDGGDGSEEDSGSDFEGLMLSSRLFSPRSGGAGSSRVKKDNLTTSATGDPGKANARTNNDHRSTTPESSSSLAKGEGKAHGGKHRKREGRRRRYSAKKRRRCGGVARASGEVDAFGGCNGEFSDNNSSLSSSTSSTDGDAPERDSSSVAKEKATDRARASNETGKPRSILSAGAKKPSPERHREENSAREEPGLIADYHHRGRATVDKTEDPARRQDGVAGKIGGEACGVGARTYGRGRKSARGHGKNVKKRFYDTSDGTENDSADSRQSASGDGSGSGSGSGSSSGSGGGSDSGRFGSNGAVRRWHWSRSDDDDDYLDDEEKLKPTLSNPPFEDPEMRPLVLENKEGGERAEVPAAVNRYLRGFQRDGVQFMWRRIRHSERPKGAILADDMGLGKTVQIIALLTALLKKTGTRQDLADMKERAKRKEPVSAAGRPVLLVCPSSVLSGWEDHLALWGFFSSQSILSSGGEGRGSIESVAGKLDRGLLEVVCVGYTLFTNNQDTLARYDWLLVVFDEVHSFKNPKTNRSQAVEKLGGAEVFIGLTGTLIQNELGEFWWIMNMIENGVLKTDAEFKQHFTTPILQGRKKGASKGDVEMMTGRLKELSVIRDKMVLRRTKEEVLGDLLRGKTGTVVFCNLTPVQSEIYRNVLSLPEFKLLAAAGDPCPCGRPGARSGSCCGMWPSDDSSRDLVDPRAVLWRKQHPTLETCGPKPACPYCCSFPALTKLQKVSNHPSLLQVDMSQGDEKKQQHEIAFAEVAFPENARAVMADCGLDGGRGGGSYSGRSGGGGGGAGGGGGGGGGRGASRNDWDKRLVRSKNFLQLCRDDLCGKMKTLKVLLKRFRHPAQKVLLFSYSTSMLDILQALMIAEGYSFLRLDGSIPVVDRKGIIKRYNDGDAVANFVFLISTRAGGTGLNLQTANKVILYDVNWNPTQDTQAEDRAYRIGQVGQVEVFRLVSTGTIEELTYMRQIYKLQTSAATMGDEAEGGLRQFEGVQGDPSQRGELWGISNLMRFSGESMLLRLRQEHSALPPIVPERDGLVMEREVDMVDIVNRAAGAAATQKKPTAVPGGGAMDDAPQRKGGEEEQDEEEEEEEEEFDGDGDEVSGILTGGGGVAAGNQADHDEDLGGVVMLHDEMVAANRHQDLPEASQGSMDVVDMTLDDTDEENDDERIRHDGVVHGGGGLSDGDAPAVAAGAFSSAAPLSSATAAGGRYSPKVSQELQDGSDGTVTSEQAATGDLFGTPRPAATAPSSAAVIVDSDATQTIQGEAQHSQNLIGGGNTTRAGIGVGPTGSGVVTQANDDIEAEATRGPMEPGWSLAETQQQSLPSPHTSQPACARPADGAGGERVGVGGGSTSTAGLEGDGGGAGDCQLLWKWEQMGAQDQYLDLSFNESVEGEEEGEPMGGGGDEGAEKRRYAGDAVDAIATSSRQETSSDCEQRGDRGHPSPGGDADESVFLSETQPRAPPR